MKRLLFIVLCLLCLFTVACRKKNETKTDTTDDIVGGWEIVLASEDKNMDEKLINYFNDAKATYTGLNLDLVALLGKQVVAGTNYMYLAKGYQTDANKATYKAVIVYHDLKGKNSITKVSDFDYTKYVNQRIEANNEKLSGGWNVESSGRPYTIFEDGENNFFEKATETLAGMNYKPIALLGKQIVAGTNYAVLCYGAATVPDAKENVYILTIYEDLQKNAEITGNAYVDLAEFNK